MPSLSQPGGEPTRSPKPLCPETGFRKDSRELRMEDRVNDYMTDLEVGHDGLHLSMLRAV